MVFEVLLSTHDDGDDVFIPRAVSLQLSSLAWTMVWGDLTHTIAGQPTISSDVLDAAHRTVCTAMGVPPASIRICCIGDSVSSTSIQNGRQRASGSPRVGLERQCVQHRVGEEEGPDIEAGPMPLRSIWQENFFG